VPDPKDHDLGAALQRVLLPPELPDVAGWAMATLYEPAGEDVLVGGDFYDWFTLPNGHVLFLVGDVSGKGPLAGALGMSIRKALKGITWVTGSAAEALPILQRALGDEFNGSFATLCLVELTPGDGRVTVVLAGHPAPWIRRGGRFSEVQAPPNGVLGLHVQERWEAVDLVLEPSDMLVLFTDGLTEAREEDGQQFGDGSLQELLAALPPTLSSFGAVFEIYERLREVSPVLPDDVILSVLSFRSSAASGRGRS
jgi:serine phosphatase RsbU (regulator of sigma subunit)